MLRICRDSLGTEFVPRGTSLPEERHERVLLNKGENSRENSFEADRPIGSPLSKGIPDVFKHEGNMLNIPRKKGTLEKSRHKKCLEFFRKNS